MDEDGVIVASDAEAGSRRMRLSNIGEERCPDRSRSSMATKDQDNRGVATHWVKLIMQMASHRPGVSLGTGVVRLTAQRQYSTGSSGRGGPTADVTHRGGNCGIDAAILLGRRRYLEHADEADDFSGWVAKRPDPLGWRCIQCRKMSVDAEP